VTYFKELAEKRMRDLVEVQSEFDKNLAELKGSMGHATGDHKSSSLKGRRLVGQKIS
jgi:hypothetical protein